MENKQIRAGRANKNVSLQQAETDSAQVPSLVQTDEGLALVGAGMELRGDFSHLLARVQKNRLSQELLVKAARIKGAQEPLAIDATAGLGEDSFLLAASGYRVVLCESNPTIAALLRDALERAATNPELSDIVSRMELYEGDSIELLANLETAPDVVYLDPMFPERTKSAAVKKKFQLLHYLEAPCANQEELLSAALSVHPKKTIVKRPAKGPYLADKKPSYSLSGKAVRFDVYVGAQTA